MKIVYFYQYFTTPNGAWSTRVYEFTRNWVAQGHEVTVVTSVYSKSDIKAKRFLEDQVIDGIKLKVINIEINNKQPIYKRVFTFLAYSFMSSWYALTLPADVVIASSGPISVGIPGLIAKYLRRRKMVFEVRDIWPDAAIELGVVTNKWVKKFAYWFEKVCYDAADLIVALSPGMKENIERRFGITKVISITNSANLSLFGNRIENANVPEYFFTKKVAIYTGNIGSTNNSELLLETAKILKSKGCDQIKILLVGDGKQKEYLEKRAADEAVDNFEIMGLMPKKELVALIQRSFVSIIPMANVPMLATSSPNKLYESLAAGVPVVQTTQGWIKEFLAEHKCGYTTQADSQELAVVLEALSLKDRELKESGQRATEIAKEYFDKDYLADKMLKGISSVVPSQKRKVEMIY
ncbi:glycosyltransferase WbuB [Solitalea longa]|uniref:Glycosyltransferase WbuB n=1 Tax=Solitalea longa TaxID=2079460 RepID=A0A2S4ZZP6_9SPHI|nr:glycosyltransferase family 4 protein [Solitalea longa]POY35786.1 glycosyltransferase WbuB [Solitalea longa]